MPRVKFDYIVSFSSEDPEHKASNLLNWEVSKKRWVCNAGEPSCSVVIQLKGSVQISAVHLGVHHAALVEVLVGRSEQPNEPFQVLVPRSVIVSPRESRGEPVGRVRSFARDALCAPARDQRWDRVRVVCDQPYNKHCQYGLSFVHIDSPESSVVAESSVSTPIPSRLTTIARYSTDDEEFTPGELFRAHRDSQETGGEVANSDAQIRQASSQALKNIPNSATKLVKTPISKNFNKTQSQSEVQPNKNRQSDKLMYTDDDQKPHDKIDRIVQRHKDEKSKAEDNKNKNDKKLNNSKNKFDDFVDNKKDDSNNKRKKDSKKESLNNSRRDDVVPSTSRDGVRRESSKKRTHAETKRKDTASKSPYTLMSGVVFALSGYEHPRRGRVRDLALSMAARYCPQWRQDCTHLVCAFPNTPKLKSVRSDPQGKSCIAVKAEWIEACSKHRRLVPWTWFATEPSKRENPPSNWEESLAEESGGDTECDTDDEIEKVLRKGKRQKLDDDDITDAPNDNLTKAPNDDVMNAPSADVTNASNDDVMGDTSRESDVAFVRDERIQANVTVEDSDSESTDIEDNTTSDVKLDTSSLLPDLFEGARLVVDENVDSEKRELICRYVTAYGGIVVKPEELLDSDSVDYTISDNVPTDSSTTVVSSAWLWECHKQQTKVDLNPYILH